jgi:hypothetical protein
MSFTPINKYLSEYLRLKCCPDMSGAGLWPNAKEITESMGAFQAVVNHILPGEDRAVKQKNLGRKDIGLVSVGDGGTPRTAALFAYRSSWECWSIDPVLNTNKHWNIKRLHIEKRKIEDNVLDMTSFEICIIVMVHSHASIKSTLANIKAKERHLVTIPCCVPHTIENKPYLGYTDKNIASPKNEVKIWVNI